MRMGRTFRSVALQGRTRWPLPNASRETITLAVAIGGIYPVRVATAGMSATWRRFSIVRIAYRPGSARCSRALPRTPAARPGSTLRPSTLRMSVRALFPRSPHAGPCSSASVRAPAPPRTPQTQKGAAHPIAEMRRPYHLKQVLPLPCLRFYRRLIAVLRTSGRGSARFARSSYLTPRWSRDSSAGPRRARARRRRPGTAPWQRGPRRASQAEPSAGTRSR